MNSVCRSVAAAFGVAAGLLAAWHAPSAQAQFFTGSFDLSAPVSVEETADSTARNYLEQVKAAVADQQWDEAVEKLRLVMENYGGKMIALDDRRYINVADFCHLQIGALPPEALALYRQRVDPLAQKWYEEGLARHDAARLSSLVHQMFCSSWGDRALWSLGEIALEQAHYSEARSAWEKLLERPPERVPAAVLESARDAGDLAADDAQRLRDWYVLDDAAEPAIYRLKRDAYLDDATAAALVRFWKQQGLQFERLSYPGTTLKLADVRAALVLVSIREGDADRAREEIETFRHLHPDAEGTLEGRAVKLADALATLLASSEKWPSQPVAADWPTFAGSFDRNRAAPRTIDVGAAAWEPISLGVPLMADTANSAMFSAHRVAEDPEQLLSCHPIVAGDLVLFSGWADNHSRIFAFNLHTGKPAWNREPPALPGEIYRDEVPLGGLQRITHSLGVPRFTLTAHDQRLYARMGSQVTSRPAESIDIPGYLVCIDLAAEGRLVWKLPAGDGRERWAFEGPPIAQGSDIYVAMRKSGDRPQADVACFDTEHYPPRLRWRSMICSAVTPGSGVAEELTHNLLTLHEGTLFYNSNLGAVAALSARDGQVQWISLYQRARKNSNDAESSHFFRDLNPCVYHRGLLLVAPSDSDAIFALDANSGQMAWQCSVAEDAVHLLGVGGGNLLASGDRLWWIDVERGTVLANWPKENLHGRGRGILAGSEVMWPTKDYIYVLDQRIPKDRHIPLLREPISLGPGRGATGGNLVVADGLLLVAGDQKLYAFHEQCGKAQPGDPTVPPPLQTNPESKARPDKPAGR